MTTVTTVFTIGHSTRTIGEFVELLHAQGVRQLVDIRTIPRSRHNPQFGQDQLPGSLAEASIRYSYLAKLGGLRSSRQDSLNAGWRNASFRSYADYMQTDDFAAGVDELVALAEKAPTAIMCAEAVPWRCHRSLVGDALLVRGLEVLDIIGPGPPRLEHLTSFAVVSGLTITYPGEATDA